MPFYKERNKLYLSVRLIVDIHITTIFNIHLCLREIFLILIYPQLHVLTLLVYIINDSHNKTTGVHMHVIVIRRSHSLLPESVTVVRITGVQLKELLR